MMNFRRPQRLCSNRPSLNTSPGFARSSRATLRRHLHCPSTASTLSLDFLAVLSPSTCSAAITTAASASLSAAAPVISPLAMLAISPPAIAVKQSRSAFDHNLVRGASHLTSADATARASTSLRHTTIA